jgi:hypothetical protein
MLLDSCVEGHIIVFDPTAKWVQKKHWVLVSQLQQLLPSVLKHDNMTIMKGVSNLKCVDCIRSSLDYLAVDLSRRLPVAVKTVFEFHVLYEAHMRP